jgi:lysophospholipase
MQEPAPFHHALAEAPDGAEALWLTTVDEVRIRAVLWPEGASGTVLAFQGRTECIEKYGRLAGRLAQDGFAMATLDWRGQGLSERLSPDRRLGHVGEMSDYQQDVAALLKLVRERGLPEPYYLIAHSMGGCIGLRALINELPVKAAAFSAPMWGIKMPPPVRVIAWGLSWLARAIGQGARYAPGGKPELYLTSAAFEGNSLTTDRDMWDYMVRQVAAEPDLGLGGPSLQWLNTSLIEMRGLQTAPLPDLPVIVGLGGDEAIVDPGAIHHNVGRWPSATLFDAPRGQHELLMERPEIRDPFMMDIIALFQAHR